MLSTKSYAALLAALCLSMSASAAEQPAQFNASNCAKPDFPPRWLSQGMGGQVTLAFLVRADGKVIESKVLETSGHSHIDRASERAAKVCGFKAGERNGVPATGWAKVRYLWVAE